MIVDLSKLRPGESVRMAFADSPAVALVHESGLVVLGGSIVAAQAALDDVRDAYAGVRAEGGAGAR